MTEQQPVANTEEVAVPVETGPTLTSPQKAATVIISMGAELASKLYQYLNEDDIAQLTREVTQMGYTTPEQTESVLDDFYKMCMTQKVISEGGSDYARSILEKAFGEGAGDLVDRVLESLAPPAFQFLNDIDSKNIFILLQHERPQTIALILSYVESEKSAEVIGRLPLNKQVEVVDRIAKMDAAAPDIIEAMETVLAKEFSSVMTMDGTQVGGVDYVADVMNNIDSQNEKTIFQELSSIDDRLASEIKKRMFLFEEIIKLDNMSIQRILRDVEQNDIVLALKGAKPEVSEVLFANMSSRMVETIQSDLEITTNVRIQDVQEARERIVDVVRRLEEEGEIVIAKGGKGDVIV